MSLWRACGARTRSPRKTCCLIGGDEGLPLSGFRALRVRDIAMDTMCVELGRQTGVDGRWLHACMHLRRSHVSRFAHKRVQILGTFVSVVSRLPSRGREWYVAMAVNVGTSLGGWG